MTQGRKSRTVLAIGSRARRAPGRRRSLPPSPRAQAADDEYNLTLPSANGGNGSSTQGGAGGSGGLLVLGRRTLAAGRSRGRLRGELAAMAAVAAPILPLLLSVAALAVRRRPPPRRLRNRPTPTARARSRRPPAKPPGESR